MSAVCTSPIPARRKGPQRAENTRNVPRISESARSLVLHLVDRAPHWPAEDIVIGELESRHVRGVRPEDIHRAIWQDRHEWRQRALTLIGHIQLGMREFARIPMDNRREHEEGWAA